MYQSSKHFFKTGERKVSRIEEMDLCRLDVGLELFCTWRDKADIVAAL